MYHRGTRNALNRTIWELKHGVADGAWATTTALNRTIWELKQEMISLSRDSAVGFESYHLGIETIKNS